MLNQCTTMHSSHPAWKNSSIIRAMAKYIWWKSAEEALEDPERIVAQVMTIGDYDDVCAIAHEIGEDGFKEVLQQAELGEFGDRSWHYWHYRLGLAKYGEVPPLPSRTFSS